MITNYTKISTKLEKVMNLQCYVTKILVKLSPTSKDNSTTLVRVPP